MENGVLLKEIWKPIEDYKGMYSVSNYGRVTSFKGEDSLILCTKKDRKGTRTVLLSKCGVQKRFRVPRLVAEAFIPNPDGKTDVIHKDKRLWNDAEFNLQWSSEDETLLFRHTDIHLPQAV